MRIEEEATRMGGLVEDLLLLAELDRGRPLRAEPVDLHRICADVVGDSNAVPHGHHLTLEAGQPVVVIGDGERLAQVAHNLVRNALAHTPPGTTVTVSTGVSEQMGYIEVADDGPGIPPAEAARVFDRFYQSDRSRSASGPGWDWPSCAPSPRPCTGRPRWPPPRRRDGATLGRQDPAGRDPRRGAAAGPPAAGPLTAAALRHRGRRPPGRWPASRSSRPPRRRGPSRPRCRRRRAA